MKILVGINTLSSLSQPIYSNHIQFFYRIGKHYPQHQLMLMTPPRMSIDRMRNESAKLAMENEAEFVIFLDDDILVPENIDVFGRWLALFEKDPKLSVLAANTVIRGYPFNNMFFKWNEGKTGLDFYNEYSSEDLDGDGLLRVDAIGCSLVMIRTAVFRELTPPFFVTGPNNTEDIYFCVKAQNAIPDFLIKTDTEVCVGHMLAPLAVTPQLKPLFKDFEEKLIPSVLEKREEDRGDNYHSSIVKHLEVSVAESVEMQG
jgi:hypothetical protein